MTPSILQYLQTRNHSKIINIILYFSSLDFQPKGRLHSLPEKHSYG